MMRSQIKFVATAATLALAFGVAAGVNGAAEPARSVMTVDGPSLVTPAGMTLYTMGETVQDGQVKWQCTNVPQNTTNDQQSGIGVRPNTGAKLIKSCLDKHKPYLADANAVPSGDFVTVKRPDGSLQWAYRGNPLYTSIKDRAPGERNGASGRGGFRGGGTRLAAPPLSIPPGFVYMRQAEGYVLAHKETGRPVYTPRAGAAVMQASSREDFQPISAPAIAKVEGDWSIVDGGMGRKQYAFRGKPLYTAAPSLNEVEILRVRNWEPVVVVKAPPVPKAIGEELTLAGYAYSDNRGRTLYTYNCSAGGFAGGVTCDDPGDPAAFMVAVCGDGKECARRWRPYIAAADAKPVGEFSLVDITYPMFTDMESTLYPADAPKVKAWAYRGKPLFTYYEDEQPGDLWGDKMGASLWGSQFDIAMVPGKRAFGFEP